MGARAVEHRARAPQQTLEDRNYLPVPDVIAREIGADSTAAGAELEAVAVALKAVAPAASTIGVTDGCSSRRALRVAGSRRVSRPLRDHRGPGTSRFPASRDSGSTACPSGSLVT